MHIHAKWKKPTGFIFISPCCWTVLSLSLHHHGQPQWEEEASWLVEEERRWSRWGWRLTSLLILLLVQVLRWAAAFSPLLATHKPLGLPLDLSPGAPLSACPGSLTQPPQGGNSSRRFVSQKGPSPVTAQTQNQGPSTFPVAKFL